MKLSPVQFLFSLILTLSSVDALAQFDATFNLADLNGDNGFTLNGESMFDRSGYSVSHAGDVNGDGIDDLIIGAYLAAEIDRGITYVVFGSDSGFPATLELSSLNGSNGFSVTGIDDIDHSGYSVSHAGDVNDDGFDDLIIGAYNAGAADDGSSYVIFGHDGGFASSFDLTSLDGMNGFAINGIGSLDKSGRSVSVAGDVNDDGVDDLIIGAYSSDSPGTFSTGSASVVYGNSNGFPATLELSSLNGSNGFTMHGVARFDSTGESVSRAGDVNGDGIDDMIVGAPDADPDGNTSAGSSYVVFGDANGFSSSWELSSLDGSNGFTINGATSNDNSGYSVSAAGDVNADGIDDLIIGAPDGSATGGQAFAGRSHVVFGVTTGFPSTLELSSLNGNNGFTIYGLLNQDHSGTSVSSAGDINADGIDDLIIGAYGVEVAGNTAAGSSYVIYGDAAGFPSSLELSSLDGTNGFVITGIAADDQSGISVSHAGDVNGDGIDDLIIGADQAGAAGAGSSYVVFGSDLIFRDAFDQ